MNTFVKEVKQREVVVQLKGTNDLVSIPCAVVVWATGIKARAFTNRVRERIGLNIQSNRMGLLTDRYLRVKGVDDGSIFAIGDCATIELKKIVDQLPNLFEEIDTNKRGTIDLQQFRSLVENKISEYPQLEAIKTAVDPFFHLFTTVRKWQVAEKKWMDGSFLDLNSEKVEAEVEEYFREIFKIKKQFTSLVKKKKLELANRVMEKRKARGL